MLAAIDALTASDIALTLRASRWSYAAVNTAHVLGIAMLVGASVPLALRLLGAWRTTPLAALVPVLAPVAAVGLALAAATGVLLLVVRADEYAMQPILWLKLAFIAAGSLSALTHHLRFGCWLAGAPRRTLVRAGAVSLLCWPSALICGRLIAFVGD